MPSILPLHRCVQQWSLCLTVWLLSICLSTSLFASNIERQIKVSFIYNFAKFVTWPVSITSNAAPFYICTQGDNSLSTSIGLLQNRAIGSRKIEVLARVQADKWRGCHILFIADGEREKIADVLKIIANNSVLTISDMPDFIHLGGIIGLSTQEDRVHFAINLNEAKKAKLTIDSQLLKLAVEVLQ